MKRILSPILSLLLILSLVACELNLNAHPEAAIQLTPEAFIFSLKKNV